MLFSPSVGMSRSIRELACLVSGSSSLQQTSGQGLPLTLTPYRGELPALKQVILSRRMPPVSSGVWRLTLDWVGVAGGTEITVVRRAGEGVLASSWITGMILLLVRRAESLSRRTEVTRPDSWTLAP